LAYVEGNVVAAAAVNKGSLHREHVGALAVHDMQMRDDQRILLLDAAEDNVAGRRGDGHALQPAAVNREDEGAPHRVTAEWPVDREDFAAHVVGDTQGQRADRAQALTRQTVTVCGSTSISTRRQTQAQIHSERESQANWVHASRPYQSMHKHAHTLHIHMDRKRSRERERKKEWPRKRTHTHALVPIRTCIDGVCVCVCVCMCVGVGVCWARTLQGKVDALVGLVQNRVRVLAFIVGKDLNSSERHRQTDPVPPCVSERQGRGISASLHVCRGRCVCVCLCGWVCMYVCVCMWVGGCVRVDSNVRSIISIVWRIDTVSCMARSCIRER
jgi:hypothetical protein